MRHEEGFLVVVVVSFCFVFNRRRILVWEDKKVLEVDGGDGCITM